MTANVIFNERFHELYSICIKGLCQFPVRSLTIVPEAKYRN